MERSECSMVTVYGSEIYSLIVSSVSIRLRIPHHVWAMRVTDHENARIPIRYEIGFHRVWTYYSNSYG